MNTPVGVVNLADQTAIALHPEAATGACQEHSHTTVLVYPLAREELMKMEPTVLLAPPDAALVIQEVVLPVVQAIFTMERASLLAQAVHSQAGELVKPTNVH